MFCTGNADAAGYLMMKSLLPENCTLNQAKHVVYRTLSESISHIAAGIGGEVEMWEIIGGCFPRRLDDREMSELGRFMVHWKSREIDILSD